MMDDKRNKQKVLHSELFETIRIRPGSGFKFYKTAHIESVWLAGLLSLYLPQDTCKLTMTVTASADDVISDSIKIL